MEDLDLAHKKSIHHRDEINKSEKCGCFYCKSIFPPSKITSWCDKYADEVGGEEYGHTALCPECSIDSVIGSASGFPINSEFLEKMNRRWF